MTKLTTALLLLCTAALCACANIPDAVIEQFTPPAAGQPNHFSLKPATAQQPQAPASRLPTRP